jgi:hypothetical protein
VILIKKIIGIMIIGGHNANGRNDYISRLFIPTSIGLIAIISVYLVLNTPTLEAATSPARQISNNTSSNKAVILPKTSSTDNNNTISCTDSSNGFTIRIPSHWISYSEPGKCSFFSPNLNQIFSPNIETFVRISVTNLPLPPPTLGISPASTPSISELEREVIFYTDGNFFKLVSGPRPISAGAFSVLYKWTGDYRAALPYVNPSVFSTTNTSTPFNISPPSSIISPPSTAQNSSQPTSSNITAADPFIAELNAIFAIRNNQIFVIEYSAPTNRFSDPVLLQAVTKMINSFTFINPAKPLTSPAAKPTYCNQPIFVNITACK